MRMATGIGYRIHTYLETEETNCKETNVVVIYVTSADVVPSEFSHDIRI